MTYLVIYDQAGSILFAQGGDVSAPEQVFFLTADVPEGKRLVSVDAETGRPVLADSEPSELEQLKARVAELEAVQAAGLGLEG